MRTALVQFASSLDPSANRDTIRGLLADLPAGEIDLVVLPEAAMCDFGSPDFDVAQVSEPLDGTFVQFLGNEARRLDTHIVAGMFEAHSSKPFNTVVALDPHGELLASYRKIHLFDSFGYRESDRFTAGPVQPCVVEINGTVWGLLTCYDLRFPELARAVLDRGAQGLIVPAAWLAGPLKTIQWETLIAARAIENVCPVIAVGQSGPTYSGRSQVIGALGEQLTLASDEPELLIIDLDLNETDAARRTNPAIDLRRFTP